jgi:hypothetical protein
LNFDDLSIQIRILAITCDRFLRENIQDIRYDKPSLMPAYASMNQKTLDDVIAYLHSLKGAP